MTTRVCPVCGKKVFPVEKQPGTGDDKDWHVHCWQKFKNDQKKDAINSHRNVPYNPLNLKKKVEHSEATGTLPFKAEAEKQNEDK